MINSSGCFAFTIPSGTIDFTSSINIPVNGNLGLFVNMNNSKINFFNALVGSNFGNNSIKQWSLKFQGLNRDGSLITQNAGLIQNPISGDWGNAFIKDTILDFVITSKKNHLTFNPGVVIGGFKPVTFSIIFNSALTSNTSVFVNINISYETLTNSNL
jgi:hypothetical protein